MPGVRPTGRDDVCFYYKEEVEAFRDWATTPFLMPCAVMRLVRFLCFCCTVNQGDTLNR